MPKLTGPKNWQESVLLAVAVLIVAVLFSLFIFYFPKLDQYYLRLKRLVVKNIPVSTPQIEVIATKGGELPLYLPNDIVLDKNARVLRGSYTEPFMFSQGGGTIYQVQSILTFATNKNTAEIFSLYEDYLKNDKWEAITPLENDNIKRLNAFKSSDKIAITISKNSLTDETTVDIFNLHIGTWASIRKSPSPSPTPAK